MNKNVMDYLDSKGFRHANKGFLMIAKAIEIAIDNRAALERMTGKDGLYSQVAELCRTTPSRAERNIRHAIETANSTVAKTHNSEFIACAVDSLRYVNSDLKGE